MPDRPEDYEAIYRRAVTVFGSQSFTWPSLAIETKRRNADIAEAVDALVESKQLEKIDGQPVLYRVKEG